MTKQEFLEEATTVLFTYFNQAVRPLGYDSPAWHEVGGDMRQAHLQTVQSFLLWCGEHYCPLLVPAVRSPETTAARPMANRGRTRTSQAVLTSQWETLATNHLAARPYSIRHLAGVLGEQTGVRPSNWMTKQIMDRCRPRPEQIGA